MKILHTADWQLGARFSQFGDKAQMLRDARLKTLERTLQLAREENVDAFIVAGDLFDDNHVDNALVDQVMDLFKAHKSVPVFLLPGNHDPYTGPGCVWEREAFQSAPDHIHVFRDVEAVEVAGSHLLASPLKQKLSTIDPSLKLDELAAGLPTEAIKIGITHGSMDIPSLRQDNDFPINVVAATRGGLIYLAIGHWHGWMTLDQDKIVMPGTPEPDDFSQTNSGFVALVNIDPSGAAQVEQRHVATLNWKHHEFDLADETLGRQRLEDDLGILDADPEKAVLRVTLTGRADPTAVSELTSWLEDRAENYAVFQLRDKSTLKLSAAALDELRGRSPLLAQVFADLDRIEAIVGEGGDGDEDPVEASDITLSALQEIADSAHIELRELSPDHINQARNLVLQNLKEEN
jgi:DNA repair exonuclease SbcCD nuclease subunit